MFLFIDNRNLGQPFKALIFDCDGILVDTEHLKFLAWQQALAQYGIEFKLEEYQPCVGHTRKNVLKMISALKGFPLPEEICSLHRVFYSAIQKEGVPVFHEAIAFVKRLAQEKASLGLKLGCASSASQEEIWANLRQIDLADAFDAVISGMDDLNAYRDPEGTNKPKPYIYIESARRLEVSPAQCAAFEDTSAGIEAAATAGMIAIAVPNELTASHNFSRAYTIINSFLPQRLSFK